MSAGTPAVVHGMRPEMVPATWPPLTDEEVRWVLAAYEPVREADAARATVTWRSPRPMSAAAVVSMEGGTAMVKRHHVAVRRPGQLAVEHAFARHLRRRGQPVPAVLSTRRGSTVVRRGDFVYEVHEQAPGVDTYRDVPSWYPFSSLGHARAAGQALARFHAAAATFPAPPRPPGVLMDSTVLVGAAHPTSALADLIAARPGLAAAVAGRPVLDDFAHVHAPVIGRVAPLLERIPPLWTHGDWHPSNLTWRSAAPEAEVTGVLDLGLANRTTAVHDLAVAIERSTIDWLTLHGQAVEADVEAIDALVGGYCDERPLTAHEWMALVELLPVVHVEYALSEVEYFGAVVSSPVDVSLAYDDYFVGHTRWFDSGNGASVLDHLRRRRAEATGA